MLGGTAGAAVRGSLVSCRLASPRPLSHCHDGGGNGAKAVSPRPCGGRLPPAGQDWCDVPVLDFFEPHAPFGAQGLHTLPEHLLSFRTSDMLFARTYSHCYECQTLKNNVVAITVVTAITGASLSNGKQNYCTTNESACRWVVARGEA